MPSLRRSATALIALVVAFSLLGLCTARAVRADDSLRKEFDRFSNVLYLLQQNYVDAPDNEKLMNGAIEGMLRTLDPNTRYIRAKRDEPAEKADSGEYAGIGISFEISNDAVVVLSMIVDTPAYRLGIHTGDRIVEFDGQPLKQGLTNDDVFKLLRGPVGSSVKVTLERAGLAEPLHFTIERAPIPVEGVPYSYMIRPGVGYVRIVRFGTTASEELGRAITNLQRQGMKKLLIDLRSNPRGLLSQAVDVLDQVVPNDQRLVYTRGRISSANADYYSTSRPDKWTQGALIILIDHGSASASEIVAGAIQDLDRGLVAGTNSFGNGLVQNQMKMTEGKLLLTIARFYTPSGRGIQRDYRTFGDTDEYERDAYKEDVPTDSALKARPQFKTGTGRTVYGGGGIYPDVVIKDPPSLTRFEVDFITRRVGFEFAIYTWLQQHANDQLTPQSFDEKFVLADDEWKSLRGVMAMGKVEMSDSTWAAEKGFMLRQVRAELASAKFGSRERYKISIEDDPQLNAALGLFALPSKLPGW